MGDKLDPKTRMMPAGTFFSMPAKMHHFAFTKKETIVEVAGMGPFTLTYGRGATLGVCCPIGSDR